MDLPQEQMMSTDNKHPLLQAAETGDCKEVERLIPLSDPGTNSEALITAARMNHVNCVSVLIPVADCKENNSMALQWAARYGHSECVALLAPLSDCDEGFAGFTPLRMAAEWGHEECVQLLISTSIEKNSAALHSAAMRGHSNCVKILIPVSDPNLGETTPIEVAARGGHTECVKLLLGVSTPNGALRMALINGYEQCAELLYPYSDISQTIRDLDEFFAANPVMKKPWIDEWLAPKLAQKQHEVLTHTLKDIKRNINISCSRGRKI